MSETTGVFPANPAFRVVCVHVSSSSSMGFAFVGRRGIILETRGTVGTLGLELRCDIAHQPSSVYTEIFVQTCVCKFASFVSAVTAIGG